MCSCRQACAKKDGDSERGADRCSRPDDDLTDLQGSGLCDDLCVSRNSLNLDLFFIVIEPAAVWTHSGSRDRFPSRFRFQQDFTAVLALQLQHGDDLRQCSFAVRLSGARESADFQRPAGPPSARTVSRIDKRGCLVSAVAPGQAASTPQGRQPARPHGPPPRRLPSALAARSGR
jgi:hypothetical protein